MHPVLRSFGKSAIPVRYAPEGMYFFSCISTLLLKLVQIYEFIGNVSKYLEKKFVNRDYLRNFAVAF